MKAAIRRDHIHHELAAEPTTAHLARRLVGDFADRAFPAPVLERIVLLTSEVVTNALLHAAPPYVLDAHLADDRLIVSVHDASSTPPRPRERRIGTPHGDRPAPPGDPCEECASLGALDADQLDDIGGWGLVLVSEMADAWGSRPTRTGKVVWFSITR